MPQSARIHALPSASAERAARRAQDDSTRSFLRMVSHELRTPLNSIIGFSEILSHELCGPLGSAQYKEYAGLIGASGHRMLRLVNQIVEIVRLEGGAADLDCTPEPPAPLVEDAFAQLREEAEAVGVRLLAIDLEGAPEAICDARGLRTVLINLLQNAIAHAPRGSAVTVSARPGHRALALLVADEGPGIAEADIQRVMRPFEQGDQALTRHTEGAGLGLPIARLLCEAMGGVLELDSPPGGGLIATITLAAA